MSGHLPIYEIERDIIARLKNDKRLILSAPTGSGKSTQVPQMLLKHGLLGSGQVVVLQPRRLATRLLAARVASELGVKLGEEVGYQIRFENVTSAKTKIRFVTEGVLLRQMIEDPQLRGVSAILFDEFHERHLYGDITLAQALDQQEKHRPDLMLAETRTDPSARYIASFEDEVFASRRKDRPDVLVRVFREQTLLLETEVEYDAAQTLIIDIELPAGSAGLSSEFETLSNLVGRYSKAPPAELRETETQRDLTFLARKTGWDARMVAMLALADQFSRLQEIGGAVPSAFFYALLRAGVPANFDVICKLDDEQLTAAWDEALAQGIIPQYGPEVRAGALAAISPLRIEKVLNIPAMDGAAPMHELLSLSNLNQLESAEFSYAAMAST